MANDNFIEKLEDFTKALEGLVDALKSQQKNSPTEILNSLADNLDAEKIAMIAENVEEIKKDSKTILSNQDKILSAVQSIKEEKQNGIIGEVGDEKSKNTILNGVKTIMLIASGVLAIGLAFKIIGNVDFFSVVSLGLAIYFIGTTFAKLVELKELTMKNVLMVGAVLPIMSLSILLSGQILKEMPVLNIFKLITIGIVGITVGISTYFLLTSISKIDKKALPWVPLMPTIIPIVAGSIVAAGLILQNMPEVGISQIITALGVSIALTPIMLSIGFMAKGLKNITLTDLLIMPLIIPAIAFSIVVSSQILSGVKPFDYIAVSLAGLAIGLAVFAMVPTIFFLNKAGLLKPTALKDLAIGALAIPLISLAIVSSSWILGLGKYESYPPVSWTIGVGLALVVFSVPMIAIGLLSMAGVGLPALSLGLVAIPIIAGAIVLSSFILSMGTYGVFPSVEWSAGVGLSLLAFGIPIVGLGTFIITTFGIGLAAIAAGIGGVLLVASGIAAASHILKEGDYKSSYPTLEWSSGVAISISAFAKSLFDISQIGGFLGFGGMDADEFSDSIQTLARGIVSAAKVFNEEGISVFDPNMVPSKEWAEGVAIAVAGFAEALMNISDIGSFLGFGGMDVDEFETAIVSVSRGIVAAARTFNESKGSFNISNVPSKSWAEGVGSALTSFTNMIKVLNEGDIELDDEDEVNMITTVLTTIAGGIIKVAQEFNKYPGIFKIYPSEEWGNGIGKAFDVFKKLLKDADPDKTKDFSKSFRSFMDSVLYMNNTFLKTDEKLYVDGGIVDLVTSKLSNLIKVIPKNEKINPLFRLADALEKVADAVDDMPNLSDFSDELKDVIKTVSKIDVSKINSLVNFGIGLNALSLVDNVKLNKTIDLLEARKKEMIGVVSSEGSSFLEEARSLFGGSVATNTASVDKKDGKEKEKFDPESLFRKQLIEHVSNIDENIKIMVGPKPEDKELEGKDVNKSGK